MGRCIRAPSAIRLAVDGQHSGVNCIPGEVAGLSGGSGQSMIDFEQADIPTQICAGAGIARQILDTTDRQRIGRVLDNPIHA